MRFITITITATRTAHIKKTKAQKNTTEYVNIQQRVDNKQTDRPMTDIDGKTALKFIIRYIVNTELINNFVIASVPLTTKHMLRIEQYSVKAW